MSDSEIELHPIVLRLRELSEDPFVKYTEVEEVMKEAAELLELLHPLNKDLFPKQNVKAHPSLTEQPVTVTDTQHLQTTYSPRKLKKLSGIGCRALFGLAKFSQNVGRLLQIPEVQQSDYNPNPSEHILESKSIPHEFP